MPQGDGRPHKTHPDTPLSLRRSLKGGQTAGPHSRLCRLKAALDAPDHSVTSRPSRWQRRNQARRAGGIDLPAWVAELDGASTTARASLRGVLWGIRTPQGMPQDAALRSAITLPLASWPPSTVASVRSPLASVLIGGLSRGARALTDWVPPCLVAGPSRSSGVVQQAARTKATAHAIQGAEGSGSARPPWPVSHRLGTEPKRLWGSAPHPSIAQDRLTPPGSFTGAITQRSRRGGSAGQRRPCRKRSRPERGQGSNPGRSLQSMPARDGTLITPCQIARGSALGRSLRGAPTPGSP